MQTHESIFSSYIVLIDVYKNGPSYRTVEPRTSGFRVASGAAVVKGDYRSPNPWSYTVDHRMFPIGTFEWKYNDGSYRHSEQGQLNQASMPGWSGGLISRNETIVYNKCVARINDQLRGELNLATTIGESRQTYRMLNLIGIYRQAITRFARSFDREIARKMRNFKSRRSLKRALRNWQNGVALRYPSRYYRRMPINNGIVSQVTALGANGWLAFTYGWTPLVGDIRAVAQNVVGFARKKRFVRARASTSPSESTVATDTSSYYPINALRKCKVGGTIACEICLELRPEFDPGLQRWTSINPLGVAYELLPFSFVFDWVLNLGQYMRDLETSLIFHSAITSGYVSRLSVQRGDCSWKGSRNTGGVTYSVDSKSTFKYTSFTRQVISSFPLPQYPALQLDLGSNRLLSAASLLRQLIK